MPIAPPDAHPSSLNLPNVLAALFKHKKKIMLAAALGLIAAAVVYVRYPPVYESDAALLVRYVLDRSVDPVESADPRSVKTNDTVIGAEVQILKSWDLAMQVAESLGAKRVLPDAKNPSTSAAAGAIYSGLQVVSRKNSNIMLVAYTNRHAEVASLVLNELVNRYFTKHLEVHRSAGAFDFVTQQTDQVRARLNQTEDALKALKTKAGMLALPSSIGALGTEVTRLNEQLSTAEAELAEQRARLKEMTQGAGQPSPSNQATPVAAASPQVGAAEAGGVTGTPESLASVTASPAPAASAAAQRAGSADVEKYKALVSRLAQLRKTDVELSAKYTPTSLMVKMNQMQIDDLERQKRSLEHKYPELAAEQAKDAAHNDLATEKARLAGLEAKAAILKSRLIQLSDIAPQITDLERNKELEETNYKYFKGTLEKARVDEALDPAKMPNISAVQRASPPVQITKARNQMVLALAGGGLALGIAFALLKELFLNYTVRRPLELESHLQTPVLLSIPYVNGQGRLRLHGGRKKADEVKLVPKSKPPERGKIAPWDVEHFIRPYAESVRDRLSLYFELNGLTHKPKLVGVAGLAEGAGASTLAAGLAAALSELSEGKVLLVDINRGPEDVHPFFKGRPALPLTAALKPAEPIAPAAENLYLATASSTAPGPAQMGLKKFFELMPNMKASDFDYIIFDMPPLTDTSATFGMAGFLDRTLLVAEAEKSNRETIKRRYRALAGNRDNVSVILNKTRNYTPKWLDGDD